MFRVLCGMPSGTFSTRKEVGSPVENIIIILLLAILTLWAICRVIVKAKKGGGCCGEHEEAVRRTGVKDRNKKHYPYRLTLLIGGMTCENCARRVENALNALPDTWANVDIGNKKATVFLKQKPDESQLRGAVASAGYVIREIQS